MKWRLQLLQIIMVVPMLPLEAYFSVIHSSRLFIINMRLIIIFSSSLPLLLSTFHQLIKLLFCATFMGNLKVSEQTSDSNLIYQENLTRHTIRRSVFSISQNREQNFMQHPYGFCFLPFFPVDVNKFNRLSLDRKMSFQLLPASYTIASIANKINQNSQSLQKNWLDVDVFFFESIGTIPIRHKN